MLDFCRKSVGADFVSIFAYSGASTPYLVGTATTTAAENARKAAVGYMEHFASDVNFGLVSRRRAGTYVTYQTADEIASSQYRHACYDRTGIADRLSLLSVGPVRSTSVSVYRSRGNGRFSDRELDRAGALLPILMASADLHGGVKEVISAPRIGTIEEMQASLRSRHPRMTVRELEVAARVKTGMSARQIAVELGIARDDGHHPPKQCLRPHGGGEPARAPACVAGRLPTNRDLLHRLATLRGRRVVQQSKYRA